MAGGKGWAGVSRSEFYRAMRAVWVFLSLAPFVYRPPPDSGWRVWALAGLAMMIAAVFMTGYYSARAELAQKAEIGED